MRHQHHGSAAADRLAPAFPSPFDPCAGSLPAQFAGKASRFLARRVVTKQLAMRNVAPLVTFTFDDVPVSACTTGAAILEQHGARATFYVSGGGCGVLSPSGRLATSDELRGVATRGHEIACHTYSHNAVSAIGAAKLDDDLEANRSFLAALGDDGAVQNFAYPYGAYSLGAKRRLEARFRSCRSVIPGVNAGRLDLGALRACPLENATTDRASIAGLIVATVKSRGWLIFFSHDVEERPSRFGVSPDLLAFSVSAAAGAGCSVVTIASGLQAVAGTSSRQRDNVPVPSQLERSIG